MIIFPSQKRIILNCNSKNIIKNGSREHKIKFIPFQNYNIELNLSVQRHICKDCKKTFSPLIDIFEDRSLNSLPEYFSRFSLEARNNLKYICMDMYSPYISLVKSIFPKAEIVLDKFHIVRAFNQTKISIMNSLKDDSLKRKLKLFWKLLQKYYPDLCQKPYYCPSFKDYLLEKSPELDINFNISRYSSSNKT